MVTERPTGAGIRDFTDFLTVSKSSTSVTKDPVRFAGFILNAMSASAGNTPKMKIINGSTSSSQVVVNTISMGAWGTNTVNIFPYVRLPRGLYVDVSGSATGIAFTVLYAPERL